MSISTFKVWWGHLPRFLSMQRELNVEGATHSFNSCIHTQHLFPGLFGAILFGKCHITSSTLLKKSKRWLWRADHSESGNEAG